MSQRHGKKGRRIMISGMGKKHNLLCVCVLLISIAITCNATNYIVGDTAGWDISTNLDAWSSSKTFVVGDVLLFQYSSYHSLNEVTKENYKACNTTNILKAYTNGNTTVTLTRPGERYFVCGNKLHCLGGMKLQINVQGNQSAYSPAISPSTANSDHDQGQGPATDLPQPTSKNNNNVNPSSSGFISTKTDIYVLSIFFFILSLTWV